MAGKRKNRKSKKKPSVDANIIGQRGEAIFINRILEHEIITECVFLGEKAEDKDYLCSFWDNKQNYPFMVQVKTTTKDYTKRERKLKVHISKEKIDKLKNNLIPTYLAGVDLNQEKVFLIGIYNQTKAISSITTRYEISFGKPNDGNENILKALKNDVTASWNWIQASNAKTKFKSQLL